MAKDFWGYGSERNRPDSEDKPEMSKTEYRPREEKQRELSDRADESYRRAKDNLERKKEGF